MDVNLLPEGARPLAAGPRVGLSLEGARGEDTGERLRWAERHGFAAVEIGATGEPWGVYAPAVDAAERDALRTVIGPERTVAILAPTQATFDVTLVSPSAAIRRASVTELWSVCRLAGALSPAGATVVIRTGVAPVGAAHAREAAHLSECLVTLDRMAGEHGATVAVLNADFFRDLRRYPALRPLRLAHTGAALDAQAALDHGADGNDLAAFVRECGDLLRHVRVPDVVSPALEPLAASLAEVGYGGMVCIVPSAAAPDPERVGQARTWWTRALGVPVTEESDDVAG